MYFIASRKLWDIMFGFDMNVDTQIQVSYTKVSKYMIENFL